MSDWCTSFCQKNPEVAARLRSSFTSSKVCVVAGVISMGLGRGYNIFFHSVLGTRDDGSLKRNTWAIFERSGFLSNLSLLVLKAVPRNRKCCQQVWRLASRWIDLYGRLKHFQSSQFDNPIDDGMDASYFFHHCGFNASISTINRFYFGVSYMIRYFTIVMGGSCQFLILFIS